MAIAENEFKYIQDLVLRRSGIVLNEGKEYLVEARLLPLAKKRGLATVADLVAQLSKRPVPELIDSVVHAMTTNETSFFRDIHPFQAFKEKIIPDILARRSSQKRLSIWCAASSTGQEPYTLAILLREHFPELRNWNVTFVASDLSLDVLNRASQGRYSQLEINRGLSANLLVKYFKKQGLEWEIAPEIRQMIDFKQINLLETWPIAPLVDVVFIRNVLIYFNTDTKKQILGRIRQLLRPDGYLFLGAAETTLNIDEQFERTAFDKSGSYQPRSAARVAA